MAFKNLVLLTDSSGKIHVFNLLRNDFQANHPIQDGTIKFKSVVTTSKYAWAIGSCINDAGDGISDQIFLFVPTPNVPIRRELVTFENQRKYLLFGFSDKLLPTDRPKWSDVDGMKETPKTSFVLPANNCWEWESDWFVEDNLDGVPLGPQGWSYALDFPLDYGPDETKLKWVRRRKWIRRKRFVAVNKWIKINADIINIGNINSINHGSSNLSLSTLTIKSKEGPKVNEETEFISIAAGFIDEQSSSANNYGAGSNGQNYVVWAVTATHQVVYRLGLNYLNCPEGSAWTLIQDQFVKMKQISIGAAINNFPNIWAISVNGELFVRSGVSKECPAGASWAPVACNFNSGIDNRIKCVSVGVGVVWVVTQDNHVFVRSGIGAKSGNVSRKVSNAEFYDTHETFLTGTSWVDMDAVMDSVCIGYNDQVFAIGVDGRQLYFRGGVDANEPKGKFWEAIKSISDATGQTDADEDLDVIRFKSASVSGVRMEYNLKSHFSNSRSSQRSNVSNKCSPTHSSSSDADARKSRTPSEYVSYNDKYGGIDADIRRNIMSKLIERRDKEMDISFLDSYEESINNMDATSHIKSGICKYVSPKDNSSLLDAGIEILKCDYSATGVIKITINDKIRKASPSQLIKEETINFIDITCVHILSNLDYKSLSHSYIAIRTFKDACGAKILFLNDSDFNEWFKLINELVNECFVSNQMISKRPDFWSLSANGDAYQGFKITDQDYFLKYSGSCHFKCIASCARQKFEKFESKSAKFGPKYENDPQQITSFGTSFDGHIYYYTNNDHDALPVHDSATYYVYENQRWNPLTGYSNFARLPTDRGHFSNESGTVLLSKEGISLPNKCWKWDANNHCSSASPSASKMRRNAPSVIRKAVVGGGGDGDDEEDKNWKVDIRYQTPGGTDKDGWQYAIDFPFSYHPDQRLTDTVRRRRWYRKAIFESVGPWKLIELPFLVKSISVCETFWKLDHSHDGHVDEQVALWAVSMDGTALCRTNVGTSKSRDSFDTSSWIPVNCSKKLLKVSICYSKNLGLSVWTVAEDGSLFLRSGTCPERPEGVDWFQIEPPKIKCPLIAVSAGPSNVMAIDYKNRLWKRVNVVHNLPMGTGWFKVAKDVESVSVSASERNNKMIVVKKKSGTSSGGYSCPSQSDAANDSNCVSNGHLSASFEAFLYQDEDNCWKRLKIPNIFTSFIFHPSNCE